VTTQLADKDISALYRATATPRIVDIPELSFLMIDGHGDPNTAPAFAEAIQSLYPLSYWIKFALKRSLGVDHKVAPLEALWWSKDFRDFSDATPNKSGWEWSAMIRQPAEATAEMVEQAVAETVRKKKLTSAPAVRLERFTEGRCAQVMHVGPYSSEGPTIKRLHEFIAAQGYVFDGQHQKHHEIYLGDPRRSAPERLRTVIRQPITLP